MDPDQSDRTENASKLRSSQSDHRLEATEEPAEEAADEVADEAVEVYCRLVVEQREEPLLAIFF